MSGTPEERLAAIEAVWAPIWDRIRTLKGIDRVQATEAAVRERIRMLEADPEAQVLAVARWEADEASARQAMEERDQRVAHVGIPLDAHGHAIGPLMRIGPDPVTKYQELAIGDQWQGYTIEGFGISVDALPGPGETWPYWFLEAPKETRSPLVDELLGDRPGLVYQLWQQIIRAPGTPVYLEVLWHPERGRSYTLQGIAADTTAQQVGRAFKGLDLQRRIDRAARARSGRTAKTAQRRAEALRLKAEGCSARETAQRMGLTTVDPTRQVRKWWQAGPSEGPPERQG